MKRELLRRAATLAALVIAAFLATAQRADAGRTNDPALAGKWRVGSFGPDGEFSYAAAKSMPRGGAGFAFLNRPDTLYMLTDHPAYRTRLLGDLTGSRLTARVAGSVSQGSEFTYFGAPDGSGRAAAVRLYFETDTSLGPITCPCQDKGWSSFWYSDPISVDLQSLAAGEVTLTAELNPASWSDGQERPGTQDDLHRVYFAQAVADVDHVGLAFGGGRHTHNGVGLLPGTGVGSFVLRSYRAEGRRG
jgi:hypothetical protein